MSQPQSHTSERPVALIRSANWFITITDGEDRPLPQSAIDALIAGGPLVYTAVHYDPVGGFNRFTNQTERFVSERRALWWPDDVGRFACEYGYFWRAVEVLRGLGYEVLHHRLDQPRVRPDCYEENWDALTARFDFREGQEDVVPTIAAHEGGVVGLPTATGKSIFIAMMCALYPHARHLVTTKRVPVAKTLVKQIGRYVSSVGQIGGGRHASNKHRVIVCTAGSLGHPPADDFDFLHADEVHELCTDNYAELLGRFRNVRRFGYSASSHVRMDNHHHRLLTMFGPVIYSMSYQEAQAFGLVAPIRVYWLTADQGWPGNPIDGVDDDIAKKQLGIWGHDYRNQLLAHAAETLFREEQQILLAVDTLEHALHLKRFLPDFELVYAHGDIDAKKRARWERQGLWPDDEPKMTKPRAELLRDRFEARDILGAIATPVWSVGVSFDSLNVVGRCDGTTSETTSVQLPGRVARIHSESGKEYGILLDVWDDFDKGSLQKAKARMKSYASRGWEQFRWSDGNPFGTPAAR